jgi:hypothetical protein
MAIILTKELDNGATGEYWKLARCEIDTTTKIVTGYFDLFKSKQWSSRDKPRLKQFGFEFTKYDNTNPVAFCYDALKKLDEFKGAADD